MEKRRANLMTHKTNHFDYTLLIGFLSTFPLAED